MSTDADKPVPVINLPPVNFIGGTTRQKRTGITQGVLDPYISVDVFTIVDVSVEDTLNDIVMKFRKLVIHMEYCGEASWVR